MPRHTLDQYETPPHYVQPLLDLVGPLEGLSIYEPCVGQRHIARFLPEETVTNDLDPACEADLHFDARTHLAWRTTIDWAITNPPFSDALPILRCAVAYAKNVAFLARLSFLEPTKTREAFWRCHPPTDVIVLPRYSFRRNDQGKRQTDNVTCCWVIYREGKPPCLRFSLQRQ